MRIARKTIERVTREKFCDVGKYRYILRDNAGYVTIERRETRLLDTLPKYGPAWEVVAAYDPNTDAWTIK